MESLERSPEPSPRDLPGNATNVLESTAMAHTTKLLLTLSVEELHAPRNSSDFMDLRVDTRY